MLNLRTKLFALFIVLFLNTTFFGFRGNFVQADFVCERFPSTCVFCSDGSNFTCVTNFYNCSPSCSWGPAGQTQTQQDYCANCNNGSSVCLSACIIKNTILETCLVGRFSYPFTTYYTQYSGTCSGGGGGGPSDYTTCTVDTLSIKYKGVDYQCNSFSMEDLTVTTGDSFDLGYRFLGTGPTYPWEVREIARGIAGALPGETTQISCIYDENWPEGVWRTAIQSGLSCPATPGVYDYTVTCRPS